MEVIDVLSVGVGQGVDYLHGLWGPTRNHCMEEAFGSSYYILCASILLLECDPFI